MPWLLIDAGARAREGKLDHPGARRGMSSIGLPLNCCKWPIGCIWLFCWLVQCVFHICLLITVDGFCLHKTCGSFRESRVPTFAITPAKKYALESRSDSYWRIEADPRTSLIHVLLILMFLMANVLKSTHSVTEWSLETSTKYAPDFLWSSLANDKSESFQLMLDPGTKQTTKLYII